MYPAPWRIDLRTGKEYMVFDTDTLIHDQLQKKCQIYGGYLPEPKDEKENTFLKDLGTGTFILGMTDKATDGQWVWESDGSLVDWTKWIEWANLLNEPNGGTAENCVAFAQQLWKGMTGHATDGWADINCTSDSWARSTKSLICEKERGLFPFYELGLITV